MNRRTIAITVAVCLAVPIILIGSNHERGNISKDEAEVHAALEAYGKAISSKDLEACMALFDPDPKTVMLGTGPGERWLGLDEIREAHARFFDSFDSEKSQATWRLMQIQGDVAWGASMREVVNYYKNEKNEFFLNISAVVVKRDGKWRVSMFHFSNLTGPDAS
jgi:uncharacterized protein (TIGR02246 family)